MLYQLSHVRSALDCIGSPNRASNRMPPGAPSGDGRPAALPAHPSSGTMSRVPPQDLDDEVPLLGGDVTVGVVRVGDTVRRPRQVQSDFVAAYLMHLERAGFDGAPRFLGVDDRGRDVLDFLPGDVPGSPPEPWSATDEALAALGRLVRRLHEASRGFRPDPARGVWSRSAQRAISCLVRSRSSAGQSSGFLNRTRCS